MLNKEYIKLKVKQAIELMPSNGVVYREILNKIGEKAGYRKVIELRGVLYSNESNSKINITLNDKGELVWTRSTETDPPGPMIIKGADG